MKVSETEMLYRPFNKPAERETSEWESPLFSQKWTEVNYTLQRTCHAQVCTDVSRQFFWHLDAHKKMLYCNISNWCIFLIMHDESVKAETVACINTMWIEAIHVSFWRGYIPKTSKDATPSPSSLLTKTRQFERNVLALKFGLYGGWGKTSQTAAVTQASKNCRFTSHSHRPM